MADSLAFTSAGTKIYASASAPATFTTGGFGALSWTEIKEISDIGTFGKKYNLVKFNPIGDRKTVKRKGSYDNGNLNLKMARAPADPGQALLLVGLDTDLSYSFKVVLQDGSISYFQAQILASPTNIGSVDSITMFECEIEVTTEILTA